MTNLKKRGTWKLKGWANALLATAAAAGLAACSSAPDAGGDINETNEPILCPNDTRAPVTSVAYPFGAIGRLNVNGGTCTATIISPNKVLTASHCIDGLALSNIAFQPQFGIVQKNVAPFPSSSPIRITRGRDDLAMGQRGADWAILTFATNFQTQLGANYQQMSRVIPGGVPFGVTLDGYGLDKFANQPSKQNCPVGLVASDDQALLHTCSIAGGESGGPLWNLSSSGVAQLLGVQSGHGSGNCSGTSGNSAANGKFYSFAPDNAGGLATAYKGDGRIAVYASDQDWTLIAAREKTSTDPSAGWTPWNANDSTFSTKGRKMAAVNLGDNRQQIWAITPAGALRTRSQAAVDGAWNAWGTQSTPTTVKDVAASGFSAGVAAHLFILGTDDIVRVAFKTGGAGSSWSAWTSLGTLNGGTAISAIYFSGVHQVFAVSTSAAFTAWDSGSGFNQLQPFGASSSGFTAVAAGYTQDGRVDVVGANDGGQIIMRIRAADGSAWTDWTTVPLSNPFSTIGFSTLATARLPDGHQQLFGIDRTNGNIYTTSDSNGGGFSAWTHFYE